MISVMTRAMNIAGVRYGRLTAIEPIPETAPTMWQCTCDCGANTKVRGTALRSGHIKSCGCLRSARAWDTARVDLTGKRYGKLVAKQATRDDGGRTAWECSCDCGKTTTIRTGLLVSGNTTSCGCGKARPTVVDQERRRAGVYAIVFASGVVKFGRAADLWRRQNQYIREAIHAGGAIGLTCPTEDGFGVESKILWEVRRSHEQLAYELFRGITERKARQLLQRHAGTKAFRRVIF